METIIKTLEKNTLSDQVKALEQENETLKSKIEDLEDEINDQDSYLGVEDCEKYSTALGDIYVFNKTGNLKLQEELDDFFEKIKTKYN